MNAPETHLAKAGCEERTCRTCERPFTPRRAWAEFCGTPCRNAFHGAERRNQAIRKAALKLYSALAALCRVEGPVGMEARAAIKDLKPPVDPKDLLKERPTS